MVKLKETTYLTSDGPINIEAWLQELAHKRKPEEMELLRRACVLSQLAGEDQAGPTGESCLRQGLAMADILTDLQLDKETLSAAIVYCSVHYSDLNIEDIKEHLGTEVAKLVEAVAQLDSIRILYGQHEYNHTQVENLRKMLLAMVEDIRVVLIKLAERTCIMRAASVLSETRQRHLAHETMDIYAPLANRLGVGQLKWELEDLAFRYLEPATYKKLATVLEERRIDREQYVKNFIHQVKQALQKAGIYHAQVTGRVKHIYSIYRKMVRKEVDYSKIYDVRAVRILVPTIEDCYNTLGIIHTQWEHIPKEFDDYIASPKPNGYRSLHTVVKGPQGRHVEVQIRTSQMHQEAELGVAAHWVYKEGAQQKTSYEGKIAWLRQVLAWQKELTETGKTPEHTHTEIFSDRIYVFTPTGDIIDLPTGATPLDFAYHIHSEVGHRCRGAKVNGSIVPLTYQLNTGERVEILTAREPSPSRDWLNPHLGYLKSSRARAKVHHWFKLQDFGKNLTEGQAILDREIRRLALPHIDYDKIARRLHFKTGKDLLAALGCGDIRLTQILSAIQTPQETAEPSLPEIIPSRPSTISPDKGGINIQGVGNLLTHMARCCHPIPGDAVMGFITQGRGVSIHRDDCINMLQLGELNRDRLIEVQWGTQQQTIYPTDIAITAYDRQGLLRDITTILTNEKANVIAVTTKTDKSDNIAYMTLTVETAGIASLSKILARISQLPNIIQAKRQV